MSCNACVLSNGCNKTGIYGRKKNSRPKYMIVLEYPYERDVKWDEFPSGDQKLKIEYMLDQAGIKRDDVYITYAIKCPISKKQAAKIKQDYLDTCSGHLVSEIQQLQPKVIITSGNIPFRMLTDESTCDEWVGHDYDTSFNDEGPDGRLKKNHLKIFPVKNFNTSVFLWKLDKDNLIALKKAKRFVEEGIVKRTKDPEVRVVLSVKDLKEFEAEMMAATECATDLETTGLDFWQHDIINSGYALSGNKAWVVFHNPYKKSHTKKWTSEEIAYGKKVNIFVKEHKALIMKTLKRVHAKKDMKWYLHNGKFDQKFCMRNGIKYESGVNFDTMIAESLIDENLGHSLNQCYVRYGINYGAYDTALYPYVGKKDQKNYQHIPPTMLAKYLGYDVCGVFKMKPKMEEQLKECHMLEHFYDMKMASLNEVITPMEFNGVPYDKENLIKSSETMGLLIKKIRKKIRILTGDKKFNPNSDVQIAKYMVAQKYPLNKLGIPKTSRGYSTNKESLKKIMQVEKYREFPELILKVKQLAKIKGTYIDGKDGVSGMIQYISKEGRLYANYNMHTATTGRYTCKRPSLQVFPRPVKNLINTRTFVLPPSGGYNLFEADFQALEQAIVAALSRDMVLISKIKDGTDIHSFNATTLGKALKWIAQDITYEFFRDHCGKGKLKEEDIPKDIFRKYDDLRTKSKTVGFGLNYGKGAESFAKEFGITVKEAEVMIAAYFRLYKDMKRWRDKIVKTAHDRGFVKLLSGRRRRFTAGMKWINSKQGRRAWSARIIKEEIARQAMNFPVQGGAHEAFESGCLRLVRRFKKEGLDAFIMLSIHDGIVGYCKPEDNALVKKIIAEEMCMIFNKGLPSELGLKIDTKFYKGCWYGEKVAA